MAFIVTESCIKCKHTDCVEVCPVDCFYEGPNFLVIHPEECIDCALCEPECPVDAIFSEDELPSDQIEFIEINAELSEIWPNITEEKDKGDTTKHNNIMKFFIVFSILFIVCWAYKVCKDELCLIHTRLLSRQHLCSRLR